MSQSPLVVPQTFSGGLKGQNNYYYFHNNTKIYLPFSLLSLHNFTVELSRSYMTYDITTDECRSRYKNPDVFY